LSQINSLASQNNQLQQSNQQLKAQLAALGEVKQENTNLRQQLGLSAATGWSVVGANIVAYEPNSYRQYITLDRGSQSGLVVGQAATSNGILVGVISQVSATTAQVQLVSDPDFRLGVQDQDTGATGLLEGQLGAGLVMGEISQTDTIHSGDTIVTSGLGGKMSPGIAIGRVQTVNTAQNEVFQSAAIAPSTDISRLRLIFVVTSL
jgi:rod shape-determining protein MreC